MRQGVRLWIRRVWRKLAMDREAARVQGEMYVIPRQLWGKSFPKKPLPPQ